MNGNHAQLRDNSQSEACCFICLLCISTYTPLQAERLLSDWHHYLSLDVLMPGMLICM